MLRSTRLASTAASGMASLGKYTLLISCVLPTMLPLAPLVALEK